MKVLYLYIYRQPAQQLKQNQFSFYFLNMNGRGHHNYLYNRQATLTNILLLCAGFATALHING